MEITLGRQEGAQGPLGLSLSAVFDHTSETIRDSVTAGLDGVRLPEIDLGRFGGRLDLGLGESTFALRRAGDRLDAQLHWVSTDLGWTRTTGDPQATPELGTVEWARDLIWRTLTGVQRVELGMGLTGSIEDPSISITSNLGEAVAASLRRELGDQIAQAEARVRQEVESRIQPLVDDARGRVDAVRTQVADEVQARREETDTLRTRLQARIDELTPSLPG
jgi:hypothetical protein